MKSIRVLLMALLAVVALAAAPQQGGTAKKTESKAAQKSVSATAGGLIDINSASEQELKQLPGIGDAYAAKIVQNRPYHGKNDLVRKKVVPEATYDKIKDKIVAKQQKK
jgi:DNA uptake protein ComE-like DNA-binding protein